MESRKMNRTSLLKLHSDLSAEAKDLMKKKNHDYSGGKNIESPFLNFTRVESMGITTTEKGFLVRLTDKISRLSTFCEEGTFEVDEESLRDTILDIINYSILLYAYVSSKPNPLATATVKYIPVTITDGDLTCPPFKKV